ncbi:hypothetical protein H0H93_009216 [Arthromyces matolae]|nr:hypothetical protein H0H93_009216 [Arthromyces matolae]
MASPSPILALKEQSRRLHAEDDKQITALAFSTNARFFATGDLLGVVLIYDAQDWRPIRCFKAKKGVAIRALTWHPKENQLKQKERTYGNLPPKKIKVEDEAESSYQGQAQADAEAMKQTPDASSSTKKPFAIRFFKVV